MIVDGKGNLFEDRRKNKNDRRNETPSNDYKNGRRKDDRRKAPEQVKKHGYTK